MNGVAPNRLPVILAFAVLAVLTMVGVSRCTGSAPPPAPSATAPSVPVPAMPARPSDADSAEATIRTVSARLNELQGVKGDQDAHANRLQELERQMAERDPGETLAKLTANLEQLTRQNAALNERILAMEARSSSGGENLSDFGIPAGAAPVGAGSGATLAVAAPMPSYAWIKPLDRQEGAITPAVGAVAQVSVPPISTSTPRFTLPINATLLNAKAMTAFIGRVPVNGTVSDPYRFKILASSEGLASNGFYLPPEIQGMVFSGSANGDWALSCVRGSIDSVTFTFEDGSVQTYGGTVAEAEGTGGTEPQRRVLGYISDGSGVPCINGERVTNAPKVLTARFAAAALEATARGYAEAQTSTVVTGAGSVVRTVDDAARFGAFTGLAGGAADSREWLESRLGQIFDAVYAPPGQTVAIHIEAQINLDERPGARQLDYHVNRGSAAALD